MTEYDIQLKAGGRRSLEEALSELERELQVRLRCYQRWIEDGKLSKTDARDRSERLESAIQLLKYFRDWIAADHARSNPVIPLDAPAETPPKQGGRQDTAQCG